MAQLVMTAGQAALQGLQNAAPAIANAAASAAANAAVNAWLTPRREGPRIAELPVQTSTDGAPMARLWGRARIAGEVIWASRFSEHSEKTGGGKGGPKQAEFSYSISFAVGLCEGEISGIGRVWANGALVDLSEVAWRLYTGSEAQPPDALIQTIEGAAAPAFRGTAYIVFEDLPLDRFGNRIPNLSFEVFRPAGEAGLERQVEGVNLIPGSGEFAYATQRVMRELGPGREQAENQNNSRGLPDFVAAIDDLERDLPNCRSVQLVVSWFGTDLRCGACDIRPGVETRDKITRPLMWAVAGEDRASAHLVSQDGGRPAYGGTPTDTSVIAAIQALKARGFKVSLYPFILMDIAAGNGLPDPYGGAEQAVFPWRGRITCHPAPGQAGTVDGSATADGQVADFFGTAAAADFSVSGGAVSYAGPVEWGLNRFILHCAALAKAAGGVDGFLIGSELVGLTTVRGAGDGYPAVAALCGLAQEARALLGPAVRLSYAADWTEYSGHQSGGGAKLFHLDPLWSHPDIDAVAIDWYVPLSDWRDGAEHLDAAAAGGPYDADYLAANVAGGEGHDWYYASPEDRTAQLRTPIADEAHGEDWLWRYKDLANWWGEVHHDRPGGVRSPTPTGWVAKSKPVWLTEVGCPAIDKGGNQPNVFVDPKSSESFTPFFSSGARDDLVQRRYLEALLGHWTGAGDNPVSPLYGGPMVEPDWVHVWTWDARPWPDFPARTEVWADGENWRLGHWLNGRAGQVPVAQIVRELCLDAGLEAFDVSGLSDILAGYLVDRPMSARSALAPLTDALGISVEAGAQAVRFRSAGYPRAAVPLAESAAADGEAAQVRRDPAPSELPRDVSLTFLDDLAGYRPGHASARDFFGTVFSVDRTVPLVSDPEQARRWCSDALADFQARAPELELVLPPSALALETGDVVQTGGRDWVLTGSAGGSLRAARAQAPGVRTFTVAGPQTGAAGDPVQPPARPAVVVLDTVLSGEDERAGPWLAGWASPWPGALDVYAGGGLRTRLERPARIGQLVTPLEAGPAGYWDRAAVFEIELYGGSLASVEPAAVLNGANRLAVQGADGGWEWLGFAAVELVAPGRWRVSQLLRGLHGSAISQVPAGAQVVVADAAPGVLPVASHEVGENLEIVAVAAGLPPTHEQARTLVAVPAQQHLLPLPPVHVRLKRAGSLAQLSWLRRTRIGGEDWAAPDVPLGEAEERYRVELLDGVTVIADAETAVPEWSYEGALPDTVAVRVRQYSARAGWGRPAVRVFAL